jgi:4-diphosphocytidyl-2-C-methyl-D-erythritol kinase
MSGSGGTCFGLFQSFELAQKAAGEISLQNPNWWVRPVVLG